MFFFGNKCKKYLVLKSPKQDKSKDVFIINFVVQQWQHSKDDPYFGRWLPEPGIQHHGLLEQTGKIYILSEGFAIYKDYFLARAQTTTGNSGSFFKE